MEMIVVILVIVGAEHGEKYAAGATMNFPQKGTFRAPPSPTFLDVNGPAASEGEFCNIDRIGIAVFGKTRTVPIVLWTAGIGRNDIHILDRSIEMPMGRRLNNFPDPFFHRRNHGTTQGS